MYLRDNQNTNWNHINNSYTLVFFYFDILYFEEVYTVQDFNEILYIVKSD